MDARKILVCCIVWEYLIDFKYQYCTYLVGDGGLIPTLMYILNVPNSRSLIPKTLNSALSLLISLRYFQLNITIKPFYEGSKLIMRILGDPMIILISGSLPIENHCQLHQWEENKTWVSKRRCSYLLENHPIQSNSIHFVDWRGKIY